MTGWKCHSELFPRCHSERSEESHRDERRLPAAISAPYYGKGEDKPHHYNIPLKLRGIKGVMTVTPIAPLIHRLRLGQVLRGGAAGLVHAHSCVIASP